MTSRKVFISHASADEHVVPLLDRLLELHGDMPWFAKRDLRGGDAFPKVIQDKLEEADALIVIVTRNTSRSAWVSAEVTRFRSKKPRALVVPLVLDDFPVDSLDQVCPDLDGVQAVCCNPGLLEGFRDLFGALGRDFLSKRELSNRRHGGERREGQDRRVTDARQRMSVGLLITYTRETGNSVAAATHLAVSDLDALRPTILRELSRYSFCDPHRNTDVAPELVVDAALHYVRMSLIRFGAKDAVQALRMLAAYVGEQYRVEMPERRQRVLRREAGTA